MLTFIEVCKTHSVSLFNNNSDGTDLVGYLLVVDFLYPSPQQGVREVLTLALPGNNIVFR